MKFHQTKLELASLSIYRNLLKDTAIGKFAKLIHCLCTDENPEKFLDLYADFFFTLAASDVSFAKYIITGIIYDENPFSYACTTGRQWAQVTEAAARDLAILQHVAEISPQEIKTQAQTKYGLQEDFLSGLPEWEYHQITDKNQPPPENAPLDTATKPPQHLKLKDEMLHMEHWSKSIDRLANFYLKTGTGIFARHYAFIWEGSGGLGVLEGITEPDPIKLTELYDYEDERTEVLENTLQFLRGYPANNVLLYGNRGTGKSSTVKALANEYHGQGLRIIEVPKDYLSDFPEIIRQLKGRQQKFIIFVDDLTFENSSENYTALKAILEGGLESRPANVLIYATSNRRHLVKEHFSDRFAPSGDGDDEIHKNDSVHEKLSLSDRFGITVIFMAPDQERYLDIVSSIAEQRRIPMEHGELRSKALKWAARHNGFSPRTARQFIDWLEGHLALLERR